MQKNNCKLKTIFKKGLSFSIALALGAAATSLNLAKTAEAAADVSNARVAYLKGEKIGKVSKVDLSADISGSLGAVSAVDSAITSATDGFSFDTVLDKAGSGNITYDSGGTANAAVTVYDWETIYTGTSVKAAHNKTTGKHDDIRNAIVENLSLNMSNSDHLKALKDLLKTGELQTIDGTKIDNVDYATHNGKEVQIKVNDVVCKLGTLEVTRAVTKVELASVPSENMYVSGDHINFDGLALKATYDDGQTGEINWTEDSKKSFIAEDKDGNTVEEGAPITKTIKGIKVSYKDSVSGNTLVVPDNDNNKFDLLFCAEKSLGNKDTVSIQGVFTDDAAVTSIVLDKNADAYKKLNAAFDKNAQVIAAYDVVLSFEGSIGASRVSFNVGKNYAGQVVTVKHLAGDKIETFVTTVDADGIVTISTSSFSPFMIVLGATEEDKAAAAETEQKNAEEAAKSEAAKSEAAKSEAAKSAAASKSASSSVKTGDASVVAFSVFGFVALISAAVLAFMKKNRKNFEK